MTKSSTTGKGSDKPLVTQRPRRKKREPNPLRGISHETAVRIRSIDAFANIVHHAIPWSAACVIAYFASNAIAALAGEATSADIKILGSLSVSNALAWLVGISGAVYGNYQRSLKNKVIERLGKRNIQLEKMIDPGRSSSEILSQESE